MAFLFLLCAAQNGLDDDEEEEGGTFQERLPPSPHQTHQRGSRPPSSRDFHKMGRRRERSPFRRELEKKRYGWWLSLSSLFPRTRLAGIPFERRTIPRSSALEKTANRDSIKSKVFGKGGMGLGEGREKLFFRKVFPPFPNLSTNSGACGWRTRPGSCRGRRECSADRGEA